MTKKKGLGKKEEGGKERTDVTFGEPSCRVYGWPLYFSFHLSVVLKFFRTKSWGEMQKKNGLQFKIKVNGRVRNKIRTQLKLLSLNLGTMHGL